MNEANIIAWLDKLTDKQFAEFFYRAVANRSTSDIPEWHGHFVLADAEQLPDEPWNIDIIGLPEEGNWAGDCPICQSGSCGTCGTSVRSIAKNVICPICSGQVYCT